MTEALAVEEDGRRVLVYPSPGHAEADGKVLPDHSGAGPVTVTEFPTVEGWADRLDEWLLVFQKAFAFDRIRKERHAYDQGTG